MRSRLLLCLLAATVSVTMAVASRAPQDAARRLAPSAMRRIATVDDRFQSYNVEMAEVIGGNFWKPYGDRASTAAPVPPSAAGAAPRSAGMDPSMFQARAPIDLANRRLRTLAAALGPAYMRTSGSWANQVYFHDADTPPPAAPPKGFQGVLTRAQWKGVVDFTHAVNGRLVSSFTITAGVRDPAGAWTPNQAERLLAYTKTAGGEITAAEFFNEPNIPSFGGAPAGYSAADYSRDFAVFRAFARRAAPAMRIVGPGSVGEGVLMPLSAGSPVSAGIIGTDEILAAHPRPAFDIFSYHFYGATSQRCAGMAAAAQTTAAAALSEEWLSRTEREYAFYRALHDRLDPALPIWVTETADSACGGNPWATSFLDSFRYLDQLGRLARRGVNAVFHNTLSASEYGLLDQNTFAPRPNYWAALLWRRLMGSTVLDAGAPPDAHLYAQCLPGRAGGVSVLAINTSRTQPRPIDLPVSADRYTLSAESLETGGVRLNGRDLALQADGVLPELEPSHVGAGTTTLAPATITFFAIPGAANPACGVPGR